MASIQCPSVEEIVTVMRGRDYKVSENPGGHVDFEGRNETPEFGLLHVEFNAL